MSQVMNVMENSLAKRLRNKRTEVAGGDITMKRETKPLVLCMLERVRMEQLFFSFQISRGSKYAHYYLLQAKVQISGGHFI